jgi:hypothetical protein
MKLKTNNFLHLKQLKELKLLAEENLSYEIDIEDYIELESILNEIEELKKKILKIIVIK